MSSMAIQYGLNVLHSRSAGVESDVPVLGRMYQLLQGVEEGRNFQKIIIVVI